MANATNGFQGEIAGLSLADVIQLKGHNKYTGCITVEYNSQNGAIYFVDGEIIHAEQDNHKGEEAIYEILKWPGGNFSLSSHMTTNICTIHCSLNFLLLEAHRRMDEENHEEEEAIEENMDHTPPPPQALKQRVMSAVAAKLMNIDAVTYAVLMHKNGQPVQDASSEAEALAAKGLVFAQSATRMGDLMGLGELKSAVAQTDNFDLLLYDSRQHYLSIAIKPNNKLDSVESEIRTALVSS